MAKIKELRKIDDLFLIEICNLFNVYYDNLNSNIYNVWINNNNIIIDVN